MRLVILIITGLFMTLSYAQPSRLTVNFAQPEGFTDATYENRYNSYQQVSQDVAAYLQQLGERYLPPGYSLKIEISDIDLAGRYEPWHAGAYHVRYMRDITWPRIHLHYQLQDDNGNTVMQQEERISDMNYLHRVRLQSYSDRLYYEKAMLRDWFRERFGHLKAVSSHERK